MRTAYAQWRPAWPEALWDVLDEVHQGPRRLAVDVGAGTGLSTRPLAARFDRVVALEPDPTMAAWDDVPDTVEVRVQAAESAFFVPGSVDLVAFGASLHWLDAPGLLSRAATWLRPRGTLAAWRFEWPRVGGALADVVRTEMVERWDAFRHPRLRIPDWTAKVVGSEEALEIVAAIELGASLSLDVAGVVGLLSTVSFVASYAKRQADPGAYFAALEARFATVIGEGEVELVLPVRGVIARTAR